MTIIGKFRLYAGYDKSRHCKECIHCKKIQTGKHSHYKCETLGMTGSVATDIRLKDFACKFFSEAKEND